MYSVPNLEPVRCSMSGSNCYFLTCIQVSQEAGKWSGIPIFWRIFQFVVIHTVKGFHIVNKAEVDVFLELSCFFNDPRDVGNLISGSSAFINLAWTSGSSWFRNCWSLAWRILSITLLACEMSAIVWYLEHSLALSLLYGPAVIAVYDYWNNHNFNYTDLCWQSNVSAF